MDCGNRRNIRLGGERREGAGTFRSVRERFASRALDSGSQGAALVSPPPEVILASAVTARAVMAVGDGAARERCGWPACDGGIGVLLHDTSAEEALFRRDTNPSCASDPQGQESAVVAAWRTESRPWRQRGS